MQFSTKTSILLAFTICTLFLGTANAISCYKCSSIEGCKNPSKVTCPDTAKGCIIVSETDPIPLLAKDCSVEPTTNEELGLNGCIKGDYKGQQLKICECQGNLCNSGGPDSLDNTNGVNQQATSIAFVSSVLMLICVKVIEA